MFLTTRNAICETANRCPALWEDDDPPAEVTDAMCEDALDDRRAYQAPIDEATRAKLDACLDAIEKTSCEILVASGLDIPECKGVESYLDLK